MNKREINRRFNYSVNYRDRYNSSQFSSYHRCRRTSQRPLGAQILVDFRLVDAVAAA